MMKHTHLGYSRPVLHNQLLTLYTNHRLPTLGSIQSIEHIKIFLGNLCGNIELLLLVGFFFFS